MLDEELLAQLQALASQMVDTRRASWVYQNDYAFVLAEGQGFQSQPLTDAERAVVGRVAEEYRSLWGPFEFQQCYANSQRVLFLDRSSRLVYVEGFVHSGRGGVHEHGWLALNGKVIDFTGSPDDPRNLPPEPPRILGEFTDRAYFGVPFKRGYVRRRSEATNGPGALIDDWEHGCPLLSERRTGWRRARRDRAWPSNRRG